MELQICDLSKKYGEKVALDKFSFVFRCGIYGIIGANGAGKTTLMNLITDTVKKDAGKILWNGDDTLELGKKFRAIIGYMPQQSGIYPEYSAKEFLYYMAELKELSRKKAREQISEILEIVNLKEVEHKKVGGFSGGMKQRVLLAQALLGDPKILILDEPTAGLDPKERLRLKNYIKKLSKDRIVFWTTHIVSDIEDTADEILILKNGQLVKHGTSDSLITEVKGKNLDDVYMAYLGEN